MFERTHVKLARQLTVAAAFDKHALIKRQAH
jgi:hypothetical protein